MARIGRHLLLLLLLAMVVGGEAAGFGLGLRGRLGVEIYNDLPDVCRRCGGISGSKAYQICPDAQGQCECCHNVLVQELINICSQYKSGGGCIQGLEDAMERKRAACKGKQQDTRNMIKDRLGGRDVFNRFVQEQAGQNLTEAADRAAGPYNALCSPKADPSCEKHSTLCSFKIGCNRKLELKMNEYRKVMQYYNRLQSQPCAPIL